MRRFAAVLALAAFGWATSAGAIPLTEDFEASPFGLWESGWFGTQSNAQNYYVVYGGLPIDHRGNNPDGLWIADTDGGTPVNIVFSPSFAATLTSFSMDLASYVDSTLTVVDKNGGVLLSTVIAAVGDAFSDPGAYVSYSVSSANGIGGFSLSGSAEGNVSIDNLSVNVAAVPLPAALPLFAAGLGVFGFLGWRRKRAAAPAVAA